MAHHPLHPPCPEKCIAPDTKTLALVLTALMILEELLHLNPKPLDLQPFQHQPGGS
ncbi:hypothetical protein DFAR_3380010 [Desulfarculales bacterium]